MRWLPILLLLVTACSTGNVTYNVEPGPQVDHIKGDPDSPVTIYAYSDFQCPFCQRFYEQAYPRIIEEYIDTGKAKLIFRDYPLRIHANAQKAAEAAECAGEQGMYYEMHDMLFEKGVNGGVRTFKRYAEDLVLNQEAFTECLDSGKYSVAVQVDMAEGVNKGVTGTPGFVINGELITGAQPFEVFKAVIDSQLQ